jgi:DNA ligase (NAD+)
VAEEGEALVRCPNPSCPAQLRRRLEHFASKDGVDIKGLGPATIAALVERGRVKSLPDLYRLRREDLLTPGREGEKTADRLLAEIEDSRHAELWRVLAGLGVPQVGAAGAKELARRFGNLVALAGAPPAEVGRDAPGRAMARFLAEANGRKLVEELIAAGVAPPKTPSQ